jgi:hypothetical protein
MTTPRLFRLSLGALLALSSSCASGSLDITTWGEDFIESGIPASTFADGGAVTYSRFLVNFADFSVVGGDGATGGTSAGPALFDLHKSGPHAITSLSDLPARRYEDIAVSVVPATGSPAVTNVDDDAATLMSDNGYAVYVEGSIALDGATKTFTWGFDTATRFTDCELEDGSLGVVVPDGSAGEWQLTIHGDHLFYDDLASEDAVLRVAAIVGADTDDDGAITREELAAVDLTTLPADQYGTGGAADVFTLDGFIADLTRTLVHHTGEGHCTATAL